MNKVKRLKVKHCEPEEWKSIRVWPEVHEAITKLSKDKGGPNRFLYLKFIKNK